MDNVNSQTPIKVFAYLRKSTEDNQEGEARKQKNSLENQRSVVKDIAQRNNLQIVRFFQDSQTGYKAFVRDDFNRMIEEFRKQGKHGNVKGIVCSEHNRLARNFGDGGLVLWFLQDGLIENIYTHDKIFTDSASDQMMLAINFAMAKLSSDETSFRSKLTHRKKAKSGQPPSQHLAGYKYRGEEGVKYWAIDHKNAEVVKEMFERFATGKYSVSEIFEYARSRELKSPKTNKLYSAEKSIRDLLKKKEYIGLFDYEGEEFIGKYPTFISEDIFYQVQEILSGTAHPKSSLVENYAYSNGLIKCAVCGGPMSGCIAKGHTYYRCANRLEPCKSSKNLRPKYLNETLVDQVVSDAFKKIEISEKKQKELRLKMTDWFEDEKSQYRIQLTQLKDRLRNFEMEFEDRAREYTQLKNIKETERDDDWEIDLDGTKRLRNHAHENTKLLKKQVEKSEELLNELPDRMLELLINIQEVGKRFQNASPSNKRNIIDTLCANIVWDGKKLIWDWKKPYNILTDSKEEGNWLPE